MTDEYLMNLNLSRYYQLVRIAAHKYKEESRNREELLAWHAWQTTAHEFSSKDKKPPDFKTWRGMVGIATDKETSKRLKPLDEEGKRELLDKTMRMIAGDSLRTASRAGHSQNKRGAYAKRQAERRAAKEKGLSEGEEPK